MLSDEICIHQGFVNRSSVVVYTYQSTTQKMETGRSGVQSQHGLRETLSLRATITKYYKQTRKQVIALRYKLPIIQTIRKF